MKLYRGEARRETGGIGLALVGAREKEKKREREREYRRPIGGHDFLKEARKNERHAEEEVPGSPLGSDWSVTGQSS